MESQKKAPAKEGGVAEANPCNLPPVGVEFVKYINY